MIRSKIYKTFLFLICLYLIAAQQLVRGQIVTSSMNPDSVRMVELFDQARVLQAQRLNLEARDNAESALQLAMGMDQKYHESRILEFIGDIYCSIEEYANAIPYYLRTANLLEMQKDSMRAARIYEKIAIAYRFEKVYGKELEYLERASCGLPSEHTRELLRLKEAMALAAYNGQNMSRAADLFRSLISDYPPKKDDWLRAKQYMVKIYDAMSKYESALICCEEQLAVYQEKGNVNQQFRLHNNIGYYQTLQEDFRSASISYNRAIETGRAIKADPRDIGLIVANAAICYQNMEDMNKSVLYFSDAIQIFDESENFAEKSRIENILASIYFEEGDLYNAGEFASRAIESARMVKDPLRSSEAYLTYSKVLREGNDPINALENYEKYLKIRDSLSLAQKIDMQEMEQRRIILEKEERDLQLRLKEEEVSDLAIKQLMLKNEQMEQEKQLLINEKNLQLLEQEKLEQEKTIADQQVKVLMQKMSNDRLREANDLALFKQRADSLEIMRQERINQLQVMENKRVQAELENESKKRKVFIIVAIAGFLIAVVILWLLISTRRKKKLLAIQKVDLEQKNEEISTQRDEIEAQRNLVFEQKEAIEQINEEVMKSIEYAKRIQSSILPEQDALLEKVSDIFVLFRPRDVVSGDFYWHAEVEGKSVFAVADSTGHGVPGAFMSMMGVSLLKEIIQKEYVTHPGVILRRMRKEIINAMGQKGVSGEQRDGYDMALITIDHDEKKIDYAGAYNSLYLVRDKSHPAPDLEELKEQNSERLGDLVLYEIAADKMPIAHYDRMDKFTNKEFPIYEGDQFYMFTDGYADQFGGRKGKKFMYKPFKTLLLKNAKEPMSVQHKRLNDTLTLWMGINPQVDDICVMGVKV